MKKIFILLFVAGLIVSCKSGNENAKPGESYIRESTGAPYEAIVISNRNLWDAQLGKDVKAFFGENEEMLNMPEPKFNIVYKSPDAIGSISKYHRNILLFKTVDTLAKPKIEVSRNVWSKPQVVVTVSAKDGAALISVFEQHKQEILNILDREEQLRFEGKLKAFASPALRDSILKSVDFYFSLPKNYEIKNSIKPDFIWLSYEMPLSSQGIVAYTYPYAGEKLDTTFLVKMRTKFVSRIPGQLPGSYMQTSDAFPPLLDTLEINGVQWLRMRGFWNVHKDFMGGPYVNYTTIDAAKNRVISLDFYVYSPDGNKGQRNYVKQLEAVARTVVF